MHPDNKFIVRRTISQERFEVLWEKSMENELTLKELTEMDEIINRDPVVLQFVLKEMENGGPASHIDRQNTIPPSSPPIQTLADKIKAFFKRLTNFCVSGQRQMAITAH